MQLAATVGGIGGAQSQRTVTPPALVISGVLHLALLALAIFGLPFLDFQRQPSEPAPIFVEFAPISNISNPPPPAPKAETPKPDPKSEQKADTPPTPKPDTQAKPTPDTARDTPPPAPQPRQQAAQPQAKPEETFDAKKLAQLLEKKVEQKPDQKKEDNKFDPNQLAALLDRRAQNRPPPSANTTGPTTPSNQTAPNQPSNSNLPVSMTDRDFIRTQVEKNWGFDPGARGVGDFVVRVSFSLNADGTLREQPKILDNARMMMSGQEAYRAFAERARRAVLRAAPFQLPPGDPARWSQEIILTFNPKDMVGG